MAELLLPSMCANVMRDSGEPTPPLMMMPPQRVPEPGGDMKRIRAVSVPGAINRAPFATVMFTPEFR